jgi:DNA-binding transcriptional LysR family regulator
VNTQQMAAILRRRGFRHCACFSRLRREDLKSGRLIQLFDVMAKSGSEYFLAYSEPAATLPKFRAFREWILGEDRDGLARELLVLDALRHHRVFAQPRFLSSS